VRHRAGEAPLFSEAMALDRDDVLHAAGLARIGLADDEVDGFLRDLSGILEHIGRISELDLADVPPTSHPLALSNRFGEDVPRPSWPREEMLELAPDPADDGFRVPPIGA
jgi:aspartyl-tRNA(Asn)/glutamyl-tRNA(Gln) amidotransferase subunit C